MSLLPISAGQITAAAVIAQQAASTASSAFRTLLNDALKPEKGKQNASSRALDSLEKASGNSSNDASSALGEIRSRLAEFLRQNGVSLTQDISLKTGTNGDIAVNGFHPLKSQIEGLINSQPELVAQIAAAVGMGGGLLIPKSPLGNS